jgi:hypothetical protein
LRYNVRLQTGFQGVKCPWLIGFSPSHRSEIMARIGPRDTKPEMAVRAKSSHPAREYEMNTLSFSPASFIERGSRELKNNRTLIGAPPRMQDKLRPQPPTRICCAV